MLQRHWGGGFYSIQLEMLSWQETTGNKKTHHRDTENTEMKKLKIRIQD
jgi:hypothetical protein